MLQRPKVTAAHIHNKGSVFLDAERMCVCLCVCAFWIKLGLLTALEGLLFPLQLPKQGQGGISLLHFNPRPLSLSHTRLAVFLSLVTWFDWKRIPIKPRQQGHAGPRPHDPADHSASFMPLEEPGIEPEQKKTTHRGEKRCGGQWGPAGGCGGRWAMRLPALHQWDESLESGQHMDGTQRKKLASPKKTNVRGCGGGRRKLNLSSGTS